jgi:putative tricarboxylic transport membrane protein
MVSIDSLAIIPGMFIKIFTLYNLMWIFLGVMVGIIFGAAPGLTATTGVALFTPITFNMSMEVSFCFLMGIYCGGFYAGSIPAILINTPGAPGNAATALDGHAMAKKGLAGDALGYSVIASWIGGTASAFALLLFAPIIGSIALKFGAPEYFSIGFLGLMCVAGVSGGSLLKGIAGACIGMLLGTIGMDPIGGISRFTFGSINMMGGIALIPALVALFAITEVFSKIETFHLGLDNVTSKVGKVIPDLKVFWKYKVTVIKSTIMGIVIGALPGTGPTIASWMCYNEAKRSSDEPEKFGTGDPEGILACEASNNAVTGGALIPLLTLGVPGDAVTAVLLGALMIQGLTPGPMLIVTRFDLVAMLLWILIIANVFMLAAGLLGSKFFPYVLRIKWPILLPIIVVLCVTGGYAVNSSFFDVQMIMIIGAIGFIMSKYGFQIAPIVLGLVLGPIIEPNLRRSLLGNNASVFLTRPLSLGILVLAFLLVFFMHRKMNQPVKNSKKEEECCTTEEV